MQDEQPPVEMRAVEMRAVEMRIGTALGVLGQLFRTRVGKLLAPTGLSYSQFSVLNHLRRGEPSSIHDLANAIEMNQPGATKLVQQLSKQGLVSVDVDPADARRRIVELTADGGELHDAASRTLSEDAPSWFEGWDPRALDEFAGSVERLAAWFDTNRLT